MLDNMVAMLKGIGNILVGFVLLVAAWFFYERMGNQMAMICGGVGILCIGLGFKHISDGLSGEAAEEANATDWRDPVDVALHAMDKFEERRNGAVPASAAAPAQARVAQAGDDLPSFDADGAFARYMAKRDAGLIEPVAPVQSQAPAFGRKAV